MRITVDKEKCIGAGQCVLAAATVFDQDDDGTVIVLDDRPGPRQEAAVREAATLCPGAAITIESC